MIRSRGFPWFGWLLLGLLAILAFALARRQEPGVKADLVLPGPAGQARPEGFARAEAPRAWRFPEDHGPHPDFQTEWWYYTGNLESKDGRRFGYQLTFFRRALAPPSERVERPSDWAAEQVYMAHFALSDVQAKQHRAFERFARGAAGLAGAQSPPYRVWLRDWSVEQAGEGLYRLVAAEADLRLELQLADARGPLLQGEAGLSRKGPGPGEASYYLSQTRLETRGTLQVGEARFDVAGLSWMDHEFSSGALSQAQVGWDWFALQLEITEGERLPVELMVYQIRREDGSADAYSSGALILPDGSARRLEREDFEIRAIDTWRSPESGAEYPAGWEIRAPAEGLRLQLEPYLFDQEMNLSYTYWEGAVKVEGEIAGKPAEGFGYAELTGYAEAMEGDF